MQVRDCAFYYYHFYVTGICFSCTDVAFTISPSAQIVGVGLQAVFRCQNLNADFIAWMVNETRVTLNMPHPDPNIRVDTTRDENNNVINLLNIAAQSKYNETVIVCVAGSIGSNDTAPVKLLIQGEPATACT